MGKGIGKNSSRSSLSTGVFIEQIEAVRRQGVEGVMIFSYSVLTDEDLSALRALNV